MKIEEFVRSIEIGDTFRVLRLRFGDEPTLRLHYSYVRYIGYFKSAFSPDTYGLKFFDMTYGIVTSLYRLESLTRLSTEEEAANITEKMENRWRKFLIEQL